MFVPRISKSFFIQSTIGAWQDTGIVAQAGEVFRAYWDGVSAVRLSSPGGDFFPIGTLGGNNEPEWLCQNVSMNSAAFVVRPVGVVPGFAIPDGLNYNAPTPDKPSEKIIVSAGRIWAGVNDKIFTDNSGAWSFVLQVGSYVYPSIQQGKTATITIEGPYTRGSGGWDGNSPGGGEFIEDFQWIVDKPDYSVAGTDASPAGWNAVLTGSGQITVTVPANAAVGQFYAVYIAEALTGDYKYAVFHVVPAPLLPPKIVATALRVNNVPVNGLLIS